MDSEHIIRRNDVDTIGGVIDQCDKTIDSDKFKSLLSRLWDRSLHFFAIVGPDLCLASVMTIIFLAAVWMLDGHIRVLQASVGVPLGIMLSLILYRSFLNSINGERKHNILIILRDWLPFLFVCFIYENLHDLSGLVQKPDIAPLLMKMDIAIFGFEPTIWAQKIHHPILTDIMAVSYAMYFILPLVIMFFLSQENRRFEFRKMALALTFAFLLGFAGYVLFPASPPRYLIQNLFTDPVRLNGPLIFNRLQDMWDGFSVISCGAFPSLHVGISAVALLYAWQFRNYSRLYKWIWWLYIPLVTSLWFSTVYLRHHWFVDILAGLAVAILAFIFSEYMLKLWKHIRARYGLSSR